MTRIHGFYADDTDYADIDLICVGCYTSSTLINLQLTTYNSLCPISFNSSLPSQCLTALLPCTTSSQMLAW
jgi:hypothetical protein